MKITVQDGQSLLDVAIQELGDWQAAVDIALINGVSLTSDHAGSELKLPDRSYSIRMQRFCKTYAVSPATMRNIGESASSTGIFTEQFTIQFV